jgi:hypothetical protein
LLRRTENLKRATEALAQKPNDPDALVDMGLAVMDGESWVLNGRQKSAIVYFKKALEIRANLTFYDLRSSLRQSLASTSVAKIVDCEEQIPSKVVGSQFSELLTIKDTGVFVS